MVCLARGWQQRYTPPPEFSVAERSTLARNIPRWKRALDLTAAAAALVVLAPLMAAIGVLVAVTMGTPVFFRQQRSGLEGKSFSLIKFRTMSDARDSSGQLLPDAKRLTLFGEWLRRTSLDELPELWNVLRGDMSLVGPRPLLPEYMELYTSEQIRRHAVLPGITGWAQVNGRNALSWEEKFRHDLYYVDNCSLWLDVKTLLLTARKVIRREGISAGDHATMPRFLGNETLPHASPLKRRSTPNQRRPYAEQLEACGGSCSETV
jgi:lipopolysaccharide/colanic/teichoic acid biosynthesis glycosyltransferase